jgi:hypothetical protein
MGNQVSTGQVEVVVNSIAAFGYQAQSDRH